MTWEVGRDCFAKYARNDMGGGQWEGLLRQKDAGSQ